MGSLIGLVQKGIAKSLSGRSVPVISSVDSVEQGLGSSGEKERGLAVSATRLVRIETPNWVAGIDGNRAAPILHWMQHWSSLTIIEYALKRDWNITIMNEKFTVKGKVKWSGSSKYQGKTLYSFRLEDQDNFFGCGISDPRVKSGDVIEFSYEVVNGKYGVILDTISLVASGPTERASGNSTAHNNPDPQYGRKQVGDAGKDSYWKDKADRDLENDGYKRANDLRIQYQSARNAAIEVTGILVQAGAIIIPEKKGAGSEVIMGKIEDLTNEFFHKCSTVGVVNEGSRASEASS